MQITKSERPHIAFFGCTNSGKSSLVNAVTNQALSVVSDIEGTTTDAVEKSMEILPLGPVVIIDTAGVNDKGGDLAQKRIAATMRILDKTDVAVLVIDSTIGLQKEDEDLIHIFEERKIPNIVVFNKSDIQTPPPHEGGGRGWGKTAAHKYSKNSQINAIELRNNATKQEKKMWQYLNKSQLGYKFRRQQPIGSYIVDFFCSSLKLIIELDGGQHNETLNIEYDKKRTEFLTKNGYRVLRIWNNDVDNNIEGVVEYIKMNLTPPPSPLPQGAGEVSEIPNSNAICQGTGEVSEIPDSNAIRQGTGKVSEIPNLNAIRQGTINEKINATKLTSAAHDDFLSRIKGSLFVSAKTGEGVNELREKLGHIINENKKEKYIIRDRLNQGDIVVLVIPIDESAPKGRIILPQQNVLREILDSNAAAICVQPQELEQILQKVTPKFVITDSQVFNKIKDIVPENIILTSFSILMAKYKGKLEELICGAKTISQLDDGDKVLISEGCTHHRQCNDIGTVKFPKWIQEFTGKDINFEFTQGGEFPQDLLKYKLIIHCGGCMLNESEMQSRIRQAKKQSIPIVNYGMAIAYMNGILDRAMKIFEI